LCLLLKQSNVRRIIDVQQAEKDKLVQVYSTFYVVWATYKKFDLHASNMKFNTLNKE